MNENKFCKILIAIVIINASGTKPLLLWYLSDSRDTIWTAMIVDKL